jgi:GDSL-like Lipase/Acylhydrolase family
MRLAALLIACSLILCSCGSGDKRGPVVAIVGDSITRVSAPKLKSELRYYGLDIRAQDKQRIDEMVPQLRTQLRRHPDAVVINLGTNDAIQAAKHPNWRPAFTTVWRLVSKRQCVIYSTINTFVDEIYGRATVAADINRAIHVLADRHKNVRIVDWNAAVHANRQLLANGNYAGDMIHPLVPRAWDWFGKHYKQALVSCGLRAEPPNRK